MLGAQGGQRGKPGIENGNFVVENYCNSQVFFKVHMDWNMIVCKEQIHVTI